MASGTSVNRADVIEIVRKVAREHGYAATVHGSLERDLDMVLVPWVECASGRKRLFRALAAEFRQSLPPVEKKPHGRVGAVLFVWSGASGWHLDVSVMPRLRGAGEKEAPGGK